MNLYITDTLDSIHQALDPHMNYRCPGCETNLGNRYMPTKALGGRGCEITVPERQGHSEARRGLPEMQYLTICEYPPIRSSVGALGTIAASAVLRWVVSGLHAHEGRIGCYLGFWRSMVRLGNHQAILQRMEILACSR